MGKIILTFNDVIELNQHLADKAMGYKVHLHDRCGSQSFTIEPLEGEEQPIEPVTNEIIEYFKNKRIVIKFSEDNHEFIVIE